MTKRERISLRKQLYDENQYCCWCGEKMEFEPDERNRNKLCTLEHHFAEGKVVLSHVACNRNSYGIIDERA